MATGQHMQAILNFGFSDAKDWFAQIPTFTNEINLDGAVGLSRMAWIATAFDQALRNEKNSVFREMV
jgi:hypothetical protein